MQIYVNLRTKREFNPLIGDRIFTIKPADPDGGIHTTRVPACCLDGRF